MGDSSALRDTVVVQMNSDITELIADNLDPIPTRPAKAAKTPKWATYCQALGAGADSLKGMKKADLEALATRLGG